MGEVYWSEAEESGKYRINAFRLIEIYKTIGISEEQFIDTIDNVKQLEKLLNK